MVNADRIGLIAGAGQLPLEAARILTDSHGFVGCVAFEGLTQPAIATEVADVTWRRLGQLEALAAALRAQSVERVLLVGKVPKSFLMTAGEHLDPDAVALSLLADLAGRDDGALMGAIADWLESQGFEVLAQETLLSPLLASVGNLTARAPTPEETADLEHGLPVARRLGEVGVGQCVVVKQGAILAVEAIEGTDATIRRTRDLGGAGSTVIKLARPGQDRRFDLPAIGPDTLQAMREVGARALAIEAGSGVLIDRARLIEEADRDGIAIWGFDGGSGAA